ncbi:hypothetical protein OUZ56_026273 [Daphnia magna]|uniref:Uncharacterized protein n=1 Tax=Daphnia magna TaxID=35525 RepID=A0ABQ9ZM24_9CRUS|nr:hypothetical protein OUZ56_026273 [Daphnia magna]
MTTCAMYIPTRNVSQAWTTDSQTSIYPGSNVVADTESAIGSGSESHIGPGHFQLESLNLVHFCYANITHKWTRFGDSSWKLPGPMCDSDLQPITAKNNIVSMLKIEHLTKHWRAVFIRDNFISSGITKMDKVWRLKLEMTRTDVRFRYAANNGAKQHRTNIQHSNIKN